MSDPVAEQLNSIVLAAAEAASSSGAFAYAELPEKCIETPADASHGDFASPIAMKLARQAKMNPLTIAEAICERIDTAGSPIEEVTVARPGFLNFRIRESARTTIISDILHAMGTFGQHSFGQNTRVQIEFVSSNPTGPLTVGHGRQAVIGDVLANIIAACGYDVTREYYFNDAGNQMNMLGASVQDRYEQLFDQAHVFPTEDRYQGEYIVDLARELRDQEGDSLRGSAGDSDSLSTFRTFAANRMISWIRKDLEEFGVRFDVWFSETTLHEQGKINAAIDLLREHGYMDEREGAVWLKSTAFGDEKDRVVIRSNGEKTYLAADIAYHMDKHDRGFAHVINVWGADHHGYVARVQAACRALGYPEDFLECLIHQMVSFRRGGEEVKMSTRRAQFVTLRDLIDEVGLDVTRYFFVMRSPDAHLVFDLDVAKADSAENPVYYIQYGHARIRSIFQKAVEAGISVDDLADVDLSPLVHEDELKLIARLAAFPDIVATACHRRAPHLVAKFIEDTVKTFHSYYTLGNRDATLRVVSQDIPLSRARLALVEATRLVIAEALDLLGIDAPERM